MKFSRTFRSLLSLALVMSHVSVLADDGIDHDPGPSTSEAIDADEQKVGGQPLEPFTGRITFRTIIPTTDRSHVDGNMGTLNLNFKSTEAGELGDVIRQTREIGLLPDWEKAPPTIYIYAPPEVIDENRDQLVTDAIRSFKEVYPGINPEIIVRPDQTNITVRAVYETQIKRLAEERAATSDPVLQGAIDQQVEILNLTYEDVKGKFDFTAQRSDKLKKKIARWRAFAVFGMRGATVFPAFFMGLGPTTLALTMSVADAGLELFTATWSQRMQQFLSRNPLALKERTFFEGTKIEITSERINAFMSVGFNTMWNLLAFVVVRATILASLQHAAVPHLTEWPTYTMLFVNVAYSLVPALLNGSFVRGYNQLVNKGQVTRAQMDMALQGNFIPDTTVSFANVVKKLGWMRNWAVPSLIGTFIGVSIWGAKAKRKTDRIVMIHDAVNLDTKGADARMEQANIEATLDISNDNRAQSFFEKMLEINELRRRRGQCELNLEGIRPVTQPPGEAA